MVRLWKALDESDDLENDEDVSPEELSALLDDLELLWVVGSIKEQDELPLVKATLQASDRLRAAVENVEDPRLLWPIVEDEWHFTEVHHSHSKVSARKLALRRKREEADQKQRNRVAESAKGKEKEVVRLLDEALPGKHGEREEQIKKEKEDTSSTKVIVKEVVETSQFGREPFKTTKRSLIPEEEEVGTFQKKKMRTEKSAKNGSAQHTKRVQMEKTSGKHQGEEKGCISQTKRRLLSNTAQEGTRPTSRQPLRCVSLGITSGPGILNRLNREALEYGNGTSMPGRRL